MKSMKLKRGGVCVEAFKRKYSPRQVWILVPLQVCSSLGQISLLNRPCLGLSLISLPRMSSEQNVTSVPEINPAPAMTA